MARILCIGDGENVLAGLHVVFEANGHRVLTSPSGLFALDLISRQHPIDAIVLDFQKMGTDGDHFARAIITIKPTLPIVLWTESTDNIPVFLKWFADAIVKKRDGPLALIAAIERALSSLACNEPQFARCVLGS